MRLLAVIEAFASIACYLAAVGEATELPRRTKSRGPPYWKIEILRRQALATITGLEGTRTHSRETHQRGAGAPGGEAQPARPGEIGRSNPLFEEGLPAVPVRSVRPAPPWKPASIPPEAGLETEIPEPTPLVSPTTLLSRATDDTGEIEGAIARLASLKPPVQRASLAMTEVEEADGANAERPLHRMKDRCSARSIQAPRACRDRTESILDSGSSTHHHVFVRQFQNSIEFRWPWEGVVMKRRFALGVLLLACVVWGVAETRAQQMPPTNIIDGMSRLNTMGLEIQTTINNQLADALQEKNLNKFQSSLSTLRKSMPKYRTQIDRTEGEAKAVVARLGSRDPGDLSQSERDELKQAQSAVVQCGELRKTYTGLTTDVDKISNHSAILTNNARTFSANTGWFRDHLRSLQGRVAAFGAGVAGAEGGSASGSGSSGSSSAGVGAPMMQLENQTTDVWFRIGGAWLKPKDPPMQVRGDMVVIQAMAMTKNRDFVMNKQPTANTTIHERSPYSFRFTVDAGAGTGEVTWQNKDETYEWHAYGPGNTTPEVKITTTKRPNDTITFMAPSVRKALGHANKVFTLGIRGSMAWDYQRSGAMGNVKRTDFENFSGTLHVLVLAR